MAGSFMLLIWWTYSFNNDGGCCCSWGESDALHTMVSFVATLVIIIAFSRNMSVKNCFSEVWKLRVDWQWQVKGISKRWRLDDGGTVQTRQWSNQFHASVIIFSPRVAVIIIINDTVLLLRRTRSCVCIQLLRWLYVSRVGCISQTNVAVCWDQRWDHSVC